MSSNKKYDKGINEKVPNNTYIIYIFLIIWDELLSPIIITLLNLEHLDLMCLVCCKYD